MGNNTRSEYSNPRESVIMSFFSPKHRKTGPAATELSSPVSETAPETVSEPIPMPAPASEVPAASAPEEASPAYAPAAPEPPAAEESAESDGMAFYGSYGAATESSAPVSTTEANEAEEAAEKKEIDFSVMDFDIPASVSASVATETDTAEESLPMPAAAPEEDDDLVLPDLPPVPSASVESKKSMGYETTVKLQNARSAYGNEKPLNEPIKTNAPKTYAPRSRDYTVVASGTAHVSGDLPKLKEGEMYVALTPKELRRLKSRRFRGLGVLATLCLAIIAAFCIWQYANSYADPLIGVWKGDVSSASIPIDQIQEINQDALDSTWEFSSSGTLYLNIVVNETPISLSGSYEKKTDDNGEPYLSMTLNNPMDGQDYTFEMYYTVTGKILQFNDMQGMNMTIDLKKD